MAFATPPFAAHIGGQDEKSLMGVIGTLGTADVGGTAPILPVGVDPLTGALYVEVLSGGSGGGTYVNIVTGTINQIGTILGIGGTVTVTGASAGTFVNISTGTLNNVGSVVGLGGTSLVSVLNGTLLNTGTTVNVATGSQQTLGTVNIVQNAGTIQGGTLNLLTTVSNLTNGSINILTGTLQSSGTTTGVGVVSALTTGSVIIQSGTLTAGTLPVVTTVSNLTNGSVNVLSGTVNSVTNLGGGTVQVNQLPTNKMTTYGTQGTAGAGTVIGTIQGTVSSGTEAIVSDWSIVVISGTPQVGLMFGSAGGAFPQGTGVIDAGQFPPGGGLAKAVESSLNSGTNGQICYMISGGTAYFKVSYYVVATTI